MRAISIYTVYRTCIWLPILVPAAVIGLASALGVHLAEGLILQVLAYSLVFGGLPYAVLAVWATWWGGGRPEVEIRRLMFRAPLLMLAVFVPLAVAVGFAIGAPRPWIAVAMLGSVIILVLGYTYVGVTVLLRDSFGPPVT